MASKKSPNFTELEKTVLIELVDSRKGIIESKQNDDSAVSLPGDWIGIYVQSKLLSDTLASQQQLTGVQLNLGLSRGYLIARSTGKSELPELDN
jgi:hypothetical protein